MVARAGSRLGAVLMLCGGGLLDSKDCLSSAESNNGGALSIRTNSRSNRRFSKLCANDFSLTLLCFTLLVGWSANLLGDRMPTTFTPSCA